MDEHATSSTSQPSHGRDADTTNRSNGPSGSADTESPHAYPGASGQNPMAAPGGASPEIPQGSTSAATPDHSDHLGGEGAYSPAPPKGEPTEGAANFTNPATNRITEANPSGDLPHAQVTYGNPQVYGNDQIGRFGTSSGSAGELRGGRMIDLANGGAAEDGSRTDPDFPEQAPTSLDAREALDADEPLRNIEDTEATTHPEQAPPS